MSITKPEQAIKILVICIIGLLAGIKMSAIGIQDKSIPIENNVADSTKKTPPLDYPLTKCIINPYSNNIFAGLTVGTPGYINMIVGINYEPIAIHTAFGLIYPWLKSYEIDLLWINTLFRGIIRSIGASVGYYDLSNKNSYYYGVKVSALNHSENVSMYISLHYIQDYDPDDLPVKFGFGIGYILDTDF